MRIMRRDITQLTKLVGATIVGVWALVNWSPVAVGQATSNGAKPGVSKTQANFRQLQFGIDNDRASEWIDCGRPGNAILAFALAAHDGQLWAGTCEAGKNETGHVYRYAGGEAWTDCGSPAPCNSVTALAAFAGKLYAGTGKYRL